MIKSPSKERKLKTVKEHCPTCDAERACDVHVHVYKPWSWEDQEGRYSMNGGVDHSLLECRGCETVFFLKDSWNSEDLDQYYGPDGEEVSEPKRDKRTYPSPTGQTKPQWFDAIFGVDYQLYNIMNEMYMAYDNQGYILAAVGLRTALDRAIEVLGIDTEISFKEKLQALKVGGWVGATEHDILDVIMEAGNAAAHRGWSPTKKDAGKLLIAVEAFLHRAFIVGQDAIAIKAGIPPKQKRKKTKAPAQNT